MPTSTSSRLFRLLLSLVVRLRLSAGRILLALRSWSTSLCMSILTFARRRSQSGIQVHASDVPVISKNPFGERSQSSGCANVEEAQECSLAVLPIRRTPTYWKDELSRHHDRLALAGPLNPIPATPEGGSQRYKPRTASQAIDLNQFNIPPGQQKLLSSLPPLPPGWKRHVHPEGIALFYHEGLRTFTECNICDDPQKEEEILACAARLFERADKMEAVTLDDHTELVLNVDDNRYWHYHFVDHTNRLLFWVDPVNVKDLSIDLQGITGYNHIKYMIEAYYWYAPSTGVSGMHTAYDVESRSHCEYYPHSRILPNEVFEDLRGMLNYAKTDMMTTDSSSSPFAQDELVKILDLVNSLNDGKRISDPHSIWAVARLMAYFTENQFLNFHGQSCARLNADTPLFGQQNWNHHFLFKATNYFLLGSPNEHAVRLQSVWVDGIIIQPRWKDFINRLTAELARYTIFSTVMLAVNFSFLPIITTGAAAGLIRILIYCSVVSTIASIVFSFGLLNVYSNPRLLIARNALEAMWLLSQTKTGMACLAITHSLPIASLIWSIALFSAALAVQIFSPKERATVATLSVEYLIIVLFVVMGVRVMRLFSKSDYGDDEYASVDKSPPLSGSLDDVEKGP